MGLKLLNKEESDANASRIQELRNSDKLLAEQMAEFNPFGDILIAIDEATLIVRVLYPSGAREIEILEIEASVNEDQDDT